MVFYFELFEKLESQREVVSKFSEEEDDDKVSIVDQAKYYSKEQSRYMSSPPKLDNYNSQANMIDDSSSILFENIKNGDKKLMIELK